MAAESDAASEAARRAHHNVALTAVRLFYDLPAYFLLKALLDAPVRTEEDGATHPVLQLDDTLAERLRLPTKHTRQLLARLHADRMVVCHQPKAKAAEGEEHASSANASMPGERDVAKYWGLDFDTLGDAVRFKMHAMDHRLAEAERTPPMQIFYCPKCMLRISALDIDYNRLINPTTGQLACPSESAACAGAELVEDDQSDKVAATRLHRAALQTQLTPLVDALRDAHELPPPTYKRARAADEEAEVAAAKARREGAARGGWGGSRGGLTNTLGASSGVADAIGSGASQNPEWIMNAAQREAKAKADAAASGEAARAAQEAADAAARASDARASAFEQTYLANYRAQQSGAPPAATQPAAAVASVQQPPPQQQQPPPPQQQQQQEEEVVLVSVAGVEMDIDEVTEEDAARMTSEEFAKFNELMQG